MRIRKITNGGRKVIGKFPSIKMGRMIMWESQIERDYLYLVELDTDVISCQEQPFFVWYYDDSDRKIHRYTPDFLLTRRNHKKQVIEIKDEKTAQSEEYLKLFQLVAPVLKREGYEYVVVTDRMIRIQPILRNAKLLQKYAKVQLSNDHLIYVFDLFAGRGELLLGELIKQLGLKGVARQEVFALLRQGILSVDLKKEICSDSLVTFAINSRANREKAA